VRANVLYFKSKEHLRHICEVSLSSFRCGDF